jgi:hypothetical protein
MNWDQAKCFTWSTTSEMFAIFPLNRISFHSGKMHYTVVSQIKCDSFLQLFPLPTELKGMKLSTNLSPYPVTFHFFHLKISFQISFVSAKFTNNCLTVSIALKQKFNFVYKCHWLPLYCPETRQQCTTAFNRENIRRFRKPRKWNSKWCMHLHPATADCTILQQHRCLAYMKVHHCITINSNFRK